MYLKVVACEVAFREICHCAARSASLFDFEFLSQGYHDNPLVGTARIQERLDAVPGGRFDGILVGYGLCNNMLSGLRAPAHTPLVIPRAHDCITFFLGSKERYAEHFTAHPGTYYYTTGWLEHRQRGGERPERKQGAGLGVQMQYETLVEKYGEDNARYLLQVMDGWTAHYERGVFIDFAFSHDLPHRQEVCDLCRRRNWAFEEIPGDLGLLQRWLDGVWDAADFLVVPPGRAVQPSYEDGVIQVEPAPADTQSGESARWP